MCVGHLALRLLGVTGVFGVHSFRLRLVDRIVPLVIDIIGGVGTGLRLDITVCQRGCLQVQGVRLDFLAVLIGLTLDGRTACHTVVQHMTDVTLVAIELEQECEMLQFHIGVLSKHAVAIQLLVHNVREEALRDQLDLQTTLIAGVVIHNIVGDVVRIERFNLAIGIHRKTDCTGDADRLCIGDVLRKNFGYAALSQIYHELGLHTFLTNRQRRSKEQYDANTIMKMLVYSRLLFPASKKSSYDDREHFFEKTDYSLDDVYRCLSFLDKHKENLQIWLNDHIKENYGRDTSLIYYDVTNYYFETDEQTDFLRKGVSKEHRPNPIVQMGLFMDNQGIPITYELFPGNTNNCLTYRPNFGRIKKQFDLGRVISVADKGMTTGDNIWYTINTPTHDGYVFSMSIRGAEKSIKDYVLEQEGYEWLGTEYKRKSRKSPRTIQVSSVSGKKIKKQVNEKQVVFWSEKYAKRAKAEREAALTKARDLAKNPGNYTRATSYGAAKYVKK